MTVTTRLETVGHWIDGARDERAERFADVHDPATGAVARRVALASEADVDRVVASARRGFEAWSAQSLSRRAAVLFRFAELLRERAGDVAALITAEHGKTLDDARGEVQRGLEVVEFATGLPHLLKGELSENVSTGVDAYSLRQPIGVSVGITPFNFPAMVPLWMLPVSLACGNAFILKPSEKDPSASLLIAELLAEAGLPAGALSVLQGDRVAVEGLLRHPGVDTVSFVGSTPIATLVYETATAHGKRVQALGGAKNHAVVMGDADIEMAADAIASAGFGSAGQRCMAISVAVAVGEETADRLGAALAERAASLRVGPGAAAETEMGPLVSCEARDRVVGHVAGAVAAGAVSLHDGRGLVVEGHEDGFFTGPTVLDRVTEEMAVYREEVFGPLLAIVRVETLNDALGLIARCDYGNGAAIFTGDGRAAREFRTRVQAGMVGINVPIPVPMSYYSFGGWKSSLFGDLHMHGREGILFYTRGKAVTERWPAGQGTGVDYGFPTL